MSGWFLLLLAATVIVVAVARNELRRSRARTEAATVEVHGSGVRRILTDGREEAVDWNEVTIVEVVRANRGPHKGSGGVILLGGGPERGCLVPLDRAADLGVISALGSLPGFEVRKLVEAMEARPPARIIVWGTRPE